MNIHKHNPDPNYRFSTLSLILWPILFGTVLALFAAFSGPRYIDPAPAPHRLPPDFVHHSWPNGATFGPMFQTTSMDRCAGAMSPLCYTVPAAPIKFVELRHKGNGRVEAFYTCSRVHIRHNLFVFYGCGGNTK